MEDNLTAFVAAESEIRSSLNLWSLTCTSSPMRRVNFAVIHHFSWRSPEMSLHEFQGLRGHDKSTLASYAFCRFRDFMVCASSAHQWKPSTWLSNKSLVFMKTSFETIDQHRLKQGLHNNETIHQHQLHIFVGPLSNHQDLSKLFRHTRLPWAESTTDRNYFLEF